MDDIVTERLGSVFRIQLNRPKKRNAMTSGMYVALADILKNAARDELTRVVLWYGAGDSFCAIFSRILLGQANLRRRSS